MYLALKHDETGMVIDQYLIKGENIQEFIIVHGFWTIGSVEEWLPMEKKEPLTRKEREELPKELIPLSRSLDEDDNDH